jgi:phosphocarrier protein HPr
MPMREITITDEVGLHARPAARFVKLATSFTADITVSKGERSANAKSLVEILQLEAGQGSIVVIEAQGDDAEEALESLVSQLDGAAN